LSLFLGFLFFLFGGLMVAYWFSGLFHSYVKGFGLVTLLILVVFVLLAVFRKALFVEPVIQTIIQNSKEEDSDDETIH